MNQKGFTLVQGLVALGIAAIGGVIGTTVLHNTFKTSFSSMERLTEESDNHTAIRDLTKELQESHIMRLRKASCGAFGNILVTTAQNSASQVIRLTTAAPSLAFLTSSYAAHAARNLTSDGDLFVTEISRFPVGSLITLINAIDSSYSGFFYVTEVVADKGLLKIAPADLASSRTPCTSVAGIISQSDLLESGKLSNQTFIIHRTHIVHYKWQRDTTTNKSTLNRAQWPEHEAATARDPKFIVVNGFKALEITSSWFAYEVVEGVRSILHGRWESDVKITADFSNAASNNSEKVSNTLTTQTSYDLPSAQRENKRVDTGAPTLRLLSPTCSINFTQVNGRVQFPDDPKFANTLQYIVTGAASEDVPGSVLVSMVPSPGSAIYCYGLSSIPPTGAVKGYGSSASLVLGRQPTGYDEFICAVRGTIQANASLSYADTSQGRMMITPCTGFQVSTPSAFRHLAGISASCTKNGTIDFGDPLIEDVQANARPGPSLYTGVTSCLWSDSVDGVGESCDGSGRAEGSELLNVNLLPGGTTINGGSLELVCL